MINYHNTGVTAELGDILASGVKLWNFDYPSYYTGQYKTAFEQKVIDHYRFRQIGQETTGRFLHYFRARMREIMPYYIEMYKTVEIMHGLENPFDNVDIVETFNEEQASESNSQTMGESSGKSTETGAETKDNTRKFSNTPQGSVGNLESYMTEAELINESVNSTNNATTENETSATSTGSATGTVKHTLTRKGNQGVNTYAHDMIEFRRSIIDVDMMIISDLNCLFLQVY